MRSHTYKLDIDDLPTQDLKDLAEIVGINKVKEIMIRMRGTRLNIPKSYGKVFHLKYIREHFNGNNHLSIARDLGISRASVYRYIQEAVI